MNIIIAGASFPCGAGGLGDVARRHGLSPTFIDHHHNSVSADGMLLPLIIGDGVPDAVIQQRGIFLPLLESWVSEGIRLPVGQALLFDRRAAAISRSKERLSATLAEAGVSYVPRQKVITLQDALQAASSCGYPVVLRADTGYSSRGVWVANSAEELQSFWSKQSEDRGNSDYAEMRLIMKADADALVIEPWLPGREWSIDCVVGPGGANLIRICEKATEVVAGKPVTQGYRLTAESDLWTELNRAVQMWCGVLFRDNELTFACFDIRRLPCGRLVPLDYGVRLGGDCVPLLVRRAGQGRNPYAAALDAALASDPLRMAAPEPGYALVHAYARQPGVFDGLRVEGHGVVVNSRQRGFVITKDNNMPVHRRVGTVLTHFDCQEDFDIACATSSEWLQVSVK